MQAVQRKTKERENTWDAKRAAEEMNGQTNT